MTGLPIKHEWACELTRIVDTVSLRDTDAHWTDEIDASKYAAVSLRVVNTTDQPISIIFAYDVGSTATTTYLQNYGGSNLGFTIPASSGSRMITPEEFPFLQYLKKIRIRYSSSTAPTSGNLTVVVAGKY